MRTITGKTHDSRRTEASLERGCLSFRRQKKNEKTQPLPRRRIFKNHHHQPKQSNAFSLPDGDDNENENDDDSEFVYEKITLLTADGVVVLPGRKLRRSSLGDDGGLDPGPLEARGRGEEEEGGARGEEEAVFSRDPFVGGEVRGDKGAGGDASRDVGSRVICLGRCFGRRRK